MAPTIKSASLIKVEVQAATIIHTGIFIIEQ